MQAYSREPLRFEVIEVKQRRAAFGVRAEFDKLAASPNRKPFIVIKRNSFFRAVSEVLPNQGPIFRGMGSSR